MYFKYPIHRPCPTRIAFMRSILDEPTDPLRRLVYADWLDEHGTTTHDRATAAFIRACLTAGKGKLRHDRLSAAGYRWLAGTTNAPEHVPTLLRWPNAYDLLPSLWLVNDYDATRRNAALDRSGRFAAVSFYRASERGLFINSTLGLNAPRGVHVTVEFWWGFVRRFEWFRAEDFREFAHYFAQDQPLAGHTFSKLAPRLAGSPSAMTHEARMRSEWFEVETPIYEYMIDGYKDHPHYRGGENEVYVNPPRNYRVLCFMFGVFPTGMVISEAEANHDGNLLFHIRQRSLEPTTDPVTARSQSGRFTWTWRSP